MHAVAPASLRAAADSQASSAVKQSTGASQAVEADEAAGPAPCARRGGAGCRARRNRARPCGCRNRRPRDRPRRNCAAPCRRSLEVEVVDASAAPARRAPPGGAAPSAPAPASRLAASRSSRVEAVERAEQVAQRVAQAAIELGLVLQDLRADAQVLGVVASRPPRGAGCRRRTASSRPAARSRCPATSTSCGPARRARSRGSAPPCTARGRACRRIPAARNGTSRDAGRSLRDRAIGRPGQVRAALLQHEGVGRAGLEPDLDDVRHLLVVVGVVVVAEEARRRARDTRRRRPPSRRPRRCARSPPGRAAARRSACRRRRRSARPRRAGARCTSPAAARSSHRGGCGPAPARSGWRRSPPAPSCADRSSSMEMNHCGVLRKISGALERQECG